jgi:ribosomal protein S18 acetylase RimI-like enzyme
MMNIRVARDEDAAAIAALNQYGQAPHLAARPDVFKATELPELEAWYRTLLGRASTRAWLAELGAEPVGYVVSILRTSEENPFCVARRWLELDQIAVVGAHRGQGIARALTERVIAHARAEGIQKVELASWSFNDAAHAAFAKLGFTAQRMRFERRVD